MPPACTATHTPRRRCAGRTRWPPHPVVQLDGPSRSGQIHYASTPGRIRLSVPRTRRAASARLGAPLLDLQGDDIRGIEVYGWGRLVVPTCRTPWEIARDHGLERDGSGAAIERRRGVGEAHHALIVERVIERRAREHQPVDQRHRDRGGGAVPEA